MRSDACLYNAGATDALPAALVAARRNAHARELAAADLLLRRKEDGRFLARLCRARGNATLLPLDPALVARPAEVAELLALLGLRPAMPLHPRRPTPLRRGRAGTGAGDPSAAGLCARLAALGLDADDYARSSGLAPVAEPRRLWLAGHDRYHRPLWLLDGAARGWRAMRATAAGDGIALEAISGFRSQAYQLGIFRRKRARGLSVAQILAVNAAPGFSEHHGGCALDIGAPGEPPAEESFEATPAFAWLQAHAARFGFRMSYPRGNPHGIVYEPWHWCWSATAAASPRDYR